MDYAVLPEKFLFFEINKLKSVLQQKFDQAGQVLEKLSLRLKSLYDIWLKKGFEPIRAEWLRYAHNIGATINVRLPKETFSGKFIGLDVSGALQLEMQDGSRKDISSGEVFTA